VRSLSPEQTSRDIALPSRVHDAVWARICECSPGCLRLLRLASVAGPDLALPILRRALDADLGDAGLLAALQEAEASDLYVSSSGTCRFVHGIVRGGAVREARPDRAHAAPRTARRGDRGARRGSAGRAARGARTPLPEYSSLFDAPEQRHALPGWIVAWAVQTQSLRVEVEARWVALFSGLERADRAACDAAGHEIERLARATGLPSAVTYARIWSAMRAQLEGPLSVALERAAQVTADPRAEWAPQSIPYMTAQQLWWLMLLGGQAERILLGAQSFAASLTRVPEGNAMLPRLYAECGRLEEARGMLGPPMRRRHGFGSGELWLFMAAIQAETCVLVGDRERAADLFASLQPYAGRMLSAVPVCVGPLARPLGSIAALLERWAEAERYFEQAAAEARGFRAPVLSALVDVERACAFRAHPDPGERRANAELHASAERAARALGLEGLVARLARA
jgi:hypothetical protein